jgi:hypothetical protein
MWVNVFRETYFFFFAVFFFAAAFFLTTIIYSPPFVILTPMRKIFSTLTSCINSYNINFFLSIEKSLFRTLDAFF